MNKKRWLAILGATILALLIFGGLHLSASPFLDFSKKNPPLPQEELDDDFDKGSAKFVSEGEDETESYSSEVILDIAYGTGDEVLGFVNHPDAPEEAGWKIAPNAMAIGQDGEIFISDLASGEYELAQDERLPAAMTPAIKVFSKSGEFVKKIKVDWNLRWTGEFGVDDENNLFILTPTRVYRMKVDLKKEGGAFKPVGPVLEEAHRLIVLPSGNYNVVDKTPMPEYNLRGRKFNKNGKLLKPSVEQHDFDANMIELEDRKGDKVNLVRLGGGLEGGQYVIESEEGDETDELIYEPHLEPGFYYLASRPIGFDDEGRFYYLRTPAPMIPLETEEDFEEYRSKIENWMDIIDLEEGSIITLRLEDDKYLTGQPDYAYKVDSKGNIYQLQVDEEGVKVIKYSRND